MLPEQVAPDAPAENVIDEVIDGGSPPGSPPGLSPGLSPDPAGLDDVAAAAIARLYGEPLLRMPTDLYIPPDALEIFLDAFEGPLDLLLYLIRKQNFNILDIPMAQVTLQYLVYVEQIRKSNLEL
ncbi:MAG: scpA/B family protein, partial [Massilia sp.]|nr:scpA/B family protein [Massilia sp.]